MGFAAGLDKTAGELCMPKNSLTRRGEDVSAEDGTGPSAKRWGFCGMISGFGGQAVFEVGQEA